MTNKEKFLALVSKEKANTVSEINQRIENRELLRESQLLAFKILERLDALGWSKSELAQNMNVKKQQVSRIVKGQGNLTMSNLIKLQNILGIPILASYYEAKKQNSNTKILTFESGRELMVLGCIMNINKPKRPLKYYIEQWLKFSKQGEIKSFGIELHQTKPINKPSTNFFIVDYIDKIK